MKFKTVFTAGFLAVMLLAPAVRAQDQPAAPAAAATSKAGMPMSLRERLAAARQARTAACEKKSAGDPCSFSRGDKNVEGKCVMGPRNQLMCRPQPARMSAKPSPSGAPQP